jgi:exodeoxyribonuclease V alpha subunit
MTAPDNRFASHPVTPHAMPGSGSDVSASRPAATPAAAATSAAQATQASMAPLMLLHRTSLPPVLQTLHAWADKGWLRRLDSALANHLFALDPTSSPGLWVAVACLSHLEGRGHTCLPVTLLCAPGTDTLSLPPEAATDVAALWASLPTDLTAWQQVLASSRLVGVATATGAELGIGIEAGEPDDHLAPLVLSMGAQPLLYLRRYWHDEGDVVRHIHRRVGSPRRVDEAAAAHWLGQFFAPAGAASAPPHAPDWQQWACALALRAGLTVITGGPGTGKTYTAARLLAVLFALSPQPQQLRVALAAPTGKAAARLRQSLAQSLAVLAPSLAGQLDLVALTQRIGPARTLHALLGVRPDSRRFVHNARNPLDVDVLVVDEASMINLEMMAALMRALPAHAQLVLLGDKDQLSSVEAGAVLGDVCRHAHGGHYNADTARYLQATTGQTMPPAFALPAGQAGAPLAQQTVMLRHSHRFAGAIGKLALAVNAGQTAKVAALLHQAPADGDLMRLSVTQPRRDEAALLAQLDDLAVAGYAPCLRAMAEGYKPDSPGGTVAAGAAPDQMKATSGEADEPLDPYGEWVRRVLTAFEGFRLLCAVHQGPFGTQGLNQRAQAALAKAGLLQPRGEWFAGRPIMVTRNDAGLGVSNGDVGIVLPGRAGADGSPGLKACFLEGDTLRTVPVGRLAHVETAFAMTVHKSQGSEFGHAVLVLPPHATAMLTRELVYTGITRARQKLTLVEGAPDALVNAVQRQASRHSGLAWRLENVSGG